jgi:hypothetical protein
MTLNGWQERLNEHFCCLHERLDVPERPIFALEHGLTEVELTDLVSSLREHARFTGPANGHWLVWVVFAAEVGYKFAGDQYWQTFASELPGWTAHEDRYFIRDAFIRFGQRFGGAQPSGPWASNFTIICWPIANAILPKDLQRHLASVLYEIRHLFTRSVIETPNALGELIDAHSIWSSSRFKQFAGQHELLGRIASALLLTGHKDAQQLILPETLRRITTDLQVEQRSREWLHDARQRANSVTFHGIRSPGQTLGPRNPQSSELEAGTESLIDGDGVQHEVLDLTVTQIDDGAWALKAVFPTFSEVLQTYPQFNCIFASRRSFVHGADRSFFPPKFFLFGRRQVTLQSLPGSDTPFLKFEDSVDGLTTLLDNICPVPQFKRLLFRLRDDGTAFRARTPLLRPGHRYLCITPDHTPQGPTLQGSRAVKVSCRGLRATLIDVPEYVSSFYHEDAARLGFDVANGLTVRPAAYPAARWDGEGTVSWLEESPKLLSVATDFEATSLTIHIFGKTVSQTETVSPSKDVPLFLDLSDLVIGEYQLSVAARLPVSGEVRTGTLLIEIEPQQEKDLDPRRSQGFAVLASPSLPTLEELWSGVATLDIYGPSGAALKCQFHFYADSDARHGVFAWSAPPITLPVSSEQWKRYLDSIKESKKVRDAYDSSSSCTVTFRSPQLGQIDLECERAFTPFRWFTKHSNGAYRLQLIQNDTMEDVSISYAAFTTPQEFTTVAIPIRADLVAQKAGGLYLAKRGDNSTAVVIPPFPITSFSDLEATASRLAPVTVPQQLSSLASIVKVWNEAQLIGDVLSSRKRYAAVLSLRTCLVESLCGGAWVALEEDVCQQRKPLEALAAKLGMMQASSLARLALAGSSEYLETTPAEIVQQLLQLLHENTPGADTTDRERNEQPRDFITTLLRYFRIEDISIDPLPSFSPACASFAFQHQWLARLARFISFVKTVTKPASHAFFEVGVS